MLHINLCNPIILDTQIPKISTEYGIPENDLYDVLGCCKMFFKHKDDVFNIKAMTYPEAIESGYSEDEGICGPDAIIRICNEIGPEFKDYLTEIDIPVDVYDRSCPVVWDDICYLFSRVERRNSRLEKVLNLEAPAIIVRNEIRILIEYIEQLEHNKLYAKDGEEGKSITYADGRIIRSLNDVGYSLVTGWDPEILEEMEKDFQQFVASIEDCENDSSESDGE